MIYRNLGRSGLKVSAISIGSWRTFGQQVDERSTESCMRAAYDAGINFFDGAEGYGRGTAESAMGAVIKSAGWLRETFIVSSKVFGVGDRPTQSGLSRKHLVEACEAAIRRMGVEYLDLFFCHRPDPSTPLEEIVHTMNELIARGRIFYWGTSEFSASDIQELHEIAARDRLNGPTMEQTNHSMLHRSRVEGELLPLFKKFDLGATIYSPLAVGLLTGKYNNGVPPESAVAKSQENWLRNGHVTEERLAKVRQLTTLAEELGIPSSQLALAWCLKNPNVSTAIIGATRPGQVIENAAATDKCDLLTEEVMSRIEAIIGPSQICA